MTPHVTDAEGDWKIVAYSQHPECVGSKIEIKGYGLDPNLFRLSVHVVNFLKCILHHSSTTNQWTSSDFFSTLFNGSPEDMKKERAFKQLISGLKRLEVQDEQKLTIEIDDGEQVRLERLP